MAEREERHPVLTGLVALVAVALVVGLLLGGVALIGTRVLGLGGGSDSGTASEPSDSLYLPSPSPTTRPSSASPSPTPSAAPSTRATRKPPAIALIAGQKRVAVYNNIDLSGTYADGEGAVLEVQRLEGDTWANFYSVNTVVVAGEFSTVVQTSRAGVNSFRVVDSDSGRASNAVKVRVG